MTPRRLLIAECCWENDQVAERVLPHERGCVNSWHQKLTEMRTRSDPNARVSQVSRARASDEPRMHET